MSGIDYDHGCNSHSLRGPAVAFPLLLQAISPAPRSLVDVGCGTGTWLRAAIDSGLADVTGMDGVPVPPHQLVVPHSRITLHDLTKPLALQRRYDVALCLEVAEHLDPDCAEVLVSSLTQAADIVVFSAACPQQPGQHHVNCRWPEYWQTLFNNRLYTCDDSIRWRLWEIQEIEPWYRQNMFIARYSPDEAGKEPRLMPVLHPDLAVAAAIVDEERRRWAAAIADGAMPLTWYLKTPATALVGKFFRFIGRG